MSIINILNLIGLLSNIIVSILLGFSLSRYLTSIHGAIFIHDKQLQSLIQRDSKILTGDLANLLRKGVENSRVRTTIGIFLITAGFVLQAIPCIFNILSNK